MINRLKNKKVGKQKGYIIILSLLFSVLSLSFSILYYGIINEMHQRQKTEVLIEDTAGYIVEFSNAVGESFKGFGAPESLKITAGILKEQDLLNSGFPENVGINQKLVAYYASNPDNKDILDYIIVLEGEVDDNKMKELGITNNIVERVNKEIVSKIERRGIAVDENTKEYQVGVFTNNNNNIISLNNSTHATQHFNIQTKAQLGIYTYAPNQIGYWKFQISPYLFPLESESARAGLFGSALRFIYSTSRSKGIINEGFSYNCPSNYNKIPLNQKNLSIFESDIKRDSSRTNSGFRTGSDLKVCIEAYKSSIIENLESESLYQVEGMFSSSSPNPIAGDPSLWGRCYPGIDNYYTRGLDQPRLAIECVDEDAENYNIIDLDRHNNIKPLNVDTYASMDYINSNLINSYEYDFRNRNDFKMPVLFFGDTLSIKVDDKYIRLLSFSSEFIPTIDGRNTYDPRVHKTYKNNGYKIVVQEQPFINNNETITFLYKDFYRNTERLEKNYKYVNKY